MGIRCFIAIGLTGQLRDSISSLTWDLRKTDADVKWVRLDDAHITLKFLGDTPEDQVPAIGKALEEAAARHGSFRVAFEGAGAFPDPRRPRVIWIGVTEGSRELVSLGGDIEVVMEGFGFAREKRGFRPHLTLGRVRSPRGRAALMRRIEALEKACFGEMDVNGFSLFRSELGPGGAKYSRLYDIGLAGGR